MEESRPPPIRTARAVTEDDTTSEAEEEEEMGPGCGNTSDRPSDDDETTLVVLEDEDETTTNHSDENEENQIDDSAENKAADYTDGDTDSRGDNETAKEVENNNGGGSAAAADDRDENSDNNHPTVMDYGGYHGNHDDDDGEPPGYYYDDVDPASVDYGYEDVTENGVDYEDIDDIMKKEENHNDYGYENAAVDDDNGKEGDDHEKDNVEDNDKEPSQQSSQPQEPQSQPPDSQQYPEYMGEFMEELDCIKDDIDVIKEATLALTSLNETVLLNINVNIVAEDSDRNGKDNTDDVATDKGNNTTTTTTTAQQQIKALDRLEQGQLAPLVETTQEQARRAKESLAQLQDETHELEQGDVMLCYLYRDEDLHTRKNLWHQLSQRFTDAQSMFDSVHDNFRADLQRRRRALRVAQKRQQLQLDMEEFYRDIGSVLPADRAAIESATLEIQGCTRELLLAFSQENDEDDDNDLNTETNDPAAALLEAKVAHFVVQTKERADQTKSCLARWKERTRELEQDNDDNDAQLSDTDLRTRKNVLNLQSRKLMSTLQAHETAHEQFQAALQEQRQVGKQQRLAQAAKEEEEEARVTKEEEEARAKEEEAESTHSLLPRTVPAAPIPSVDAASSESHHPEQEEEDDGFDYLAIPIASPRQRQEEIITSPSVWWMVDLAPCYDAREALHQPGATLLVKRCLQAYNWTTEHARRVLKAYRQFITLKKELKDWHGNPNGSFVVVPCPAVYQMWKEHIVDMDRYFADCQLLTGGHILRHGPVDHFKDDDNDAAAQRRTLHRHMKGRFGDQFDAELWGYKDDDDLNNASSKLKRFSSLRSIGKKSLSSSGRLSSSSSKS